MAARRSRYSSRTVVASREFSAGGVVVWERGGHWQVAVIRPAGKSVTALPKGHIDGVETAEQAARREVNEETGLTVELMRKLDDVNYVYRFRGRAIFKNVVFFLYRYVSGEIDQLQPVMRKEVDRAYWLPLEEAQTSLTYPGERKVVELAAAALAEAPAPVTPNDG